MAREDARTAVRCTVLAFSPPCTRSPDFEVGNERERAIASDRCVNSSTSDKIVKGMRERRLSCWCALQYDIIVHVQVNKMHLIS